MKQGVLYKRRGDKTLAKERTKKYVTLTSDARLTYHPNLNVRLLFLTSLGILYSKYCFYGIFTIGGIHEGMQFRFV